MRHQQNVSETFQLTNIGLAVAFFSLDVSLRPMRDVADEYAAMGSFGD